MMSESLTKFRYISGSMKVFNDQSITYNGLNIIEIRFADIQYWLSRLNGHFQRKIVQSKLDKLFLLSFP